MEVDIDTKRNSYERFPFEYDKDFRSDPTFSVEITWDFHFDVMSLQDFPREDKSRVNFDEEKNRKAGSFSFEIVKWRVSLSVDQKLYNHSQAGPKETEIQEEYEEDRILTCTVNVANVWI